MIGHSFIVTTDGKTHTTKTHNGPIQLAELQAAVHGYLEAVPYLTTIVLNETETHECVAFCNEEGKINGLPLNVVATKMWMDQLPQHFALNDALFGDVIFVWGDEEFMDQL